MDLDKIQTLFNNKKYGEVKLLLKDDLANSDPNIQYILAMIYNEEKDFPKAFLHFQKASNLNHPESLRCLGIYYYQGLGCHIDEVKGLEYVNKAIELGSVRAYCTLAHIYMNGLGVAKDLHQGFLLYEEAAKLGDDHAIEHLIECYKSGIGVKKDLVKAEEYQKKLNLVNKEK